MSAPTTLVAGAMLIGATTAHAADIKLIASAAVKEAELIPAFDKATGHKVTTIGAGTGAITTRISGGEGVDIVLIAAPNIDSRSRRGSSTSTPSPCGPAVPGRS